MAAAKWTNAQVLAMCCGSAIGALVGYQRSVAGIATLVCIAVVAVLFIIITAPAQRPAVVQDDHAAAGAPARDLPAAAAAPIAVHGGEVAAAADVQRLAAAETAPAEQLGGDDDAAADGDGDASDGDDGSADHTSDSDDAESQASDSSDAKYEAEAALIKAAREVSLDGLRASLAAGAPAMIGLQDVVRGSSTVDDALRVEAMQLLFDQRAADEPHLQWTLEHAMYDALDQRRNPAVVQWLLDAGVDAGCRPHGMSPLLTAVRRADVARLLIEAGADVNACDCVDIPILHVLVERDGCDFEVPRMLVESGVDINTVSARGETPLDVAVRAVFHGALYAVDRALELGADPSMGKGASVSLLEYYEELLREAGSGYGSDQEDDHEDAEVMQFHWHRPRGMALLMRLAQAAAWHRRKHLLLAVRGRYEAPLADVGTEASASGCAHVTSESAQAAGAASRGPTLG